MLKVKEIRSTTISLEANINYFFNKEDIKKENLIDIKYISVGMPQTIQTSALIIYDK